MQECLNVARLQEESSHKTKVYSTDNMFHVKAAQKKDMAKFCCRHVFFSISQTMVGFLTNTKCLQYMLKTLSEGLGVYSLSATGQRKPAVETGQDNRNIVCIVLPNPLSF